MTIFFQFLQVLTCLLHLLLLIIIEPHKIDMFVYPDTFEPFSCNTSAKTIVYLICLNIATLGPPTNPTPLGRNWITLQPLGVCLDTSSNG